MKLSDLNIHDVGVKISQVGAIYADEETIYILPFPENNNMFTLTSGMFGNLKYEPVMQLEVLELTTNDWERFLRQTDLVEVEGINKAILRKSQRNISQHAAWAVYRRDDYKCRYCGASDVPLTIDHIDLWTHGGISEKENLLSTCKKCNQKRGDIIYEDWIVSDKYKKLSSNLSESVKAANISILGRLEYLRSLRVSNQRKKRK